MDGRSQELLWDLLRYGKILFCDKCVDEHNEKVEATGEDQEITTPFAKYGVLRFSITRRSLDSPQTSQNQL